MFFYCFLDSDVMDRGGRLRGGLAAHGYTWKL